MFRGCVYDAMVECRRLRYGRLLLELSVISRSLLPILRDWMKVWILSLSSGARVRCHCLLILRIVAAHASDVNAALVSCTWGCYFVAEYRVSPTFAVDSPAIVTSTVETECGAAVRECLDF